MATATKFTHAELQMSAAVITPFSDAADGAHVLDDIVTRCATVKLQGHHTEITDVGGIFCVQLMGRAHHFNYPMVTIAEGENPGGVTGLFWDNDTAMAALVGSVRVVGMGLKINSVSSEDVTEGTLVGGYTEMPIEHPATVFHSATWMEEQMIDPHVFEAKKGITVRWQPVNTVDREFRTLGGGTNYENNDFIGNPTIIGRGWDTTQVLLLEMVCHLEVRPTRESVLIVNPSPYGENYALLLAAAAMAPLATEGHSFTTFLAIAKSVGLVARDLLRTGIVVSDKYFPSK